MFTAFQHHVLKAFSVHISASALNDSVSWEVRKRTSHNKALGWVEQENLGNNLFQRTTHIFGITPYICLNRLISFSEGHVAYTTTEED